jgi:DNA topoisomerase-1
MERIVAKNLVIVESPAKARTIERYLGKGFRVQASMGHVRDLPPKKLGVDIENDFEPTYQLLRGKTKAVNALKKAAKSAGDVYMATDLDREGEAIAWHLCEALGLEPEAVKRVVFNEITRGAIQRAFSEPGRIDMDKVSAQEARRILDRLVGYKLSPLLWKKIAKGLSAGRVQSVAVRLIVEREREIRDFRPEESWRITAHLRRPDDERVFKAALAEVEDEKFAAKSEADVAGVFEALDRAAYTVRSVEKKRTKDRPPPPFITSHLQRTASTRLSFSTKKTMTLAQRLYQGVELGSEGSVALITYMRTDSHRVAASAQSAARELIGTRFGEDYLPDEAPRYRSKGRAQEAHEAIRPTDVARTPESVKGHLGRDEARLYELIWNRFVASQMRPALWDVTDVQVEARGEGMTGLFKARGRTLVFDGYTKVAGVRMNKDDQELPPLAEGDGLDLEKLEPTQHFSQPPARYNEASLVRKLEELGIGRPSTYASIVSTIQERGYTEQKKNLFLRCARHPKCQYTVPCDLAGKPIGPEVREAPTHDASTESQSGVPTNGTTWLCNACDAEMEQKTGRRCFYATQLGEVVTDKLVAHFPKIMDTGFTSHMEDELDDVEEAKSDWLQVVREFWGPFSEALERASDEMESAKNEVAEDAGPCPECGGNLLKRWSKRGPFLGCSNYPECKFTRPLEGEARPDPQATEHECEKCGGKMLLREGRRGPFLGCENFPKCRNTLPVDAEGNPVRPEPTGETCDKCGAEMVIRSGRRGRFLACSAFPKCRNTKPLPENLKAKAGAKSKGSKGAAGGSRKGAKSGTGKSGGGRKKAVETDRECPDCGQTLVIRNGRRGPFLGCSGYPKCRHTEDVPPDLQDAVES